MTRAGECRRQGRCNLFFVRVYIHSPPSALNSRSRRDWCDLRSAWLAPWVHSWPYSLYSASGKRSNVAGIGSPDAC
jgi:hypothetical protein